MTGLGDRRRTGIGLEVTPTVVRGIVLEDGNDGVVAVHELPVARLDDDDAVVDVLTRLHHLLDAGDRATRVAWFPAGATLQRIEVTGQSGPELNALRHRLDEHDGVNATMLLDVGVRRWMVALRWNETAARRLQTIAERAGFVDAEIEPSPIAAHRALADDATVFRRDAGRDSSWAMLRDRDLPMLATTLPAGHREYPSAATGTAIVAASDGVVDQATLVANVNSALGSAFEDDRTTMSELELGLRLLGKPYPPFPAHDLRAPQRVCVALGAALGAAGHHGTLRPIDSMTTTRPSVESERLPWTLERVVDTPEDVPNEAPSRWKRLIARPAMRRR